MGWEVEGMRVFETSLNGEWKEEVVDDQRCRML